MGLLNLDERQKLINLLCKLPLVQTYLAIARIELLVTLPDDLWQNIIFINSPRSDIARIVDEVSNDAWAWTNLPESSYPLLVVIKNAINMVNDSPLESELYVQMNLVRAKFNLPPEGIRGLKPPKSPSQFMQKLQSMIVLLPLVKTELEHIRKIFGHYLLKQKCQDASTRLNSLCMPVRKFTTILEQSEDLKVRNKSSTLRSTLYSFNDQTKLIENSISRFAANYGTVLEEKQPSEERVKIQEELDILIKYCESVSEAMKGLNNLLNAYNFGKQEK